MENYKDYFKNRQEVEDYFGDEQFKFSFMSDNTIHYESLNPRFLNNELIKFKISLYYKSGEEFFAYDGFGCWGSRFQLSEVECTSLETHERTSMFFAKYTEL